ncbi:MAG: hypothetical protein AAGE52_23930 [Myxococcota bacterium]
MAEKIREVGDDDARWRREKRLIISSLIFALLIAACLFGGVAVLGAWGESQPASSPSDASETGDSSVP